MALISHSHASSHRMITNSNLSYLELISPKFFSITIKEKAKVSVLRWIPFFAASIDTSIENRHFPLSCAITIVCMHCRFPIQMVYVHYVRMWWTMVWFHPLVSISVCWFIYMDRELLENRSFIHDRLPL